MRENWSVPFRYIVGIFSFVLLVAVLIYARDAVTNLAIAAFVAYLINPAVVYLTTRTRMQRVAAVNLVYFSAVILLIGLPATLLPIFADEAQFVIEDILNLANQLRQTLSSPIRIGGLVFHLEEWGQSIFQAQNAVLSPIPEQTLRLLETTSVGEEDCRAGNLGVVGRRAPEMAREGWRRCGSRSINSFCFCGGRQYHFGYP